MVLHLFRWSFIGRGVILEEEDLAILSDLLKPAAIHWQTIGLALGFLNYELTTIEHNPSLFRIGDTGYFREMLSLWLRWAPPNHSWPTLETLAVALRSSGDEHLAANLLPEFIKRLRKHKI